MARNGLVALADEICDCQSLEVTVAQFHRTFQHPYSPSLVQNLDLSDNALTSLPGGACAPGHWQQLTRLGSLDLRGNRIACLPSSLGALASVRDGGSPVSAAQLAGAGGLRYDPDELSDLPAEVAEAGANPLLAYLAGCHASLIGGRLDLSGKGLANAPRHLQAMGHLVELRLGNNPLSELPE